MRAREEAVHDFLRAADAPPAPAPAPAPAFGGAAPAPAPSSAAPPGAPPPLTAPTFAAKAVGGEERVGTSAGAGEAGALPSDAEEAVASVKSCD